MASRSKQLQKGVRGTGRPTHHRQRPGARSTASPRGPPNENGPAKKRSRSAPAPHSYKSPAVVDEEDRKSRNLSNGPGHRGGTHKTCSLISPQNKIFTCDYFLFFHLLFLRTKLRGRPGEVWCRRPVRRDRGASKNGRQNRFGRAGAKTSGTRELETAGKRKISKRLVLFQRTILLENGWNFLLPTRKLIFANSS
jgi:hypothetical protein